MDKFKGVAALRKTIELVLQKLNMYQDKMNEISREELLEIMGNENLDLSWIASQESVDALRSEIDDIKSIVNKINKDTMKTIGTAADMSIFENQIRGSYMEIYGPVVTDPEGEVTIYSQYIGGSSNTAYSTKLTSYGTSGRNIHLTKCSSLTIQDSVTLDSEDSDHGVIGYICANNTNLESVDIGNLIGYTNGSYKYVNGKSYGMFGGCTKLKNVHIGYLKLTSAPLASAPRMFNDCTSLTKLDLTGLDLSALSRSPQGMFENCTNLTEILVRRDRWYSGEMDASNFINCGVDHVTYVD